MRTLSAALLTAQQGTAKKPYMKITINSVDLSSRLLQLEHHEEAYRDRALLVFRNDDRFFDDYDFNGYDFRIGYGLNTGNNVAEPNGDGAGNEYSYAPDLWVKSQQLISSEGQLYCQLYCEGMWMYLREQRVMAYGTAPYYFTEFNRTLTVYELIESLVETAMGWTLEATPSPDDGILNTFKPYFVINQIPFENAAEVLYRLICMTKCYLRMKATKTVQIVYPQTTDADQRVYYSGQSPFFYEFVSKSNVTVPNRVAVYCNRDSDGGWTGLITGDTGAKTEQYDEVLEPFIAEGIITQEDADNRAAALLTRIKAEQLAAKLTIPHDCGMELYDKIGVVDTRGA